MRTQGRIARPEFLERIPIEALPSSMGNRYHVAQIRVSWEFARAGWRWHP
jgi:hypothetical protein